MKAGDLPARDSAKELAQKPALLPFHRHCEYAVVHSECGGLAIGGDPQIPSTIESDVVRRGKCAHLTVIETAEVGGFGAERWRRAVDRLGGRIAAEDKYLPRKGQRRRIVAVFSKLDNMAVPVAGPRVRCIDRWIGVDPAVGIVG